jgi:NAD(P)-dependent dehydrogenase (short-subunit alcohol dehydrogenase family)
LQWAIRAAAWITWPLSSPGVSKGIGKEIARQFADAGFTVYAGSRDATRGERAVEEIGAISLKIVNKPMATPNGGSRALWRRGASPASIHRIVSNGTLLAATGRQQSLFHATQLVRA